ncbi:MAG TPA: hypothetical protein VMU81_03340 [Acetobacteraceae bacterium]|nr:hypothetical protein [Acetobacteraceae bacterium]
MPPDGGTALSRSLALTCVVLAAVALTACGGPEKMAKAPPLPTVIVRPVITHPTTPQIPLVEFGKRPPNTPMTSANMPYFDTVAYCEWSTDKKEKLRRGPLYEACIGDQANYRQVIGSAIDARQFKDSDIVRCAKSSRTAYQGMWYCLNDQPYS